MFQIVSVTKQSEPLLIPFTSHTQGNAELQVHFNMVEVSLYREFNLMAKVSFPFSMETLRDARSQYQLPFPSRPTKIQGRKDI